MRKSFYRRLIILAGMLSLLALSLPLGPSSGALRSPCTDCRRACRNDYIACISLGLAGCEEVQAQCLADCPCP